MSPSFPFPETWVRGLQHYTPFPTAISFLSIFNNLLLTWNKEQEWNFVVYGVISGLLQPRASKEYRLNDYSMYILRWVYSYAGMSLGAKRNTAEALNEMQRVE